MDRDAKGSPPWSATTKLVIALTFIAAIAGLLLRFHTLIGPLLIAFVLAYLFQPVVAFLDRHTPLSWRAAVGVFYLGIILLLLSLLTLSGVGLIQQIQSLIRLIDTALTELPSLIAQASGQAYRIGPFTLDLTQLDLDTLSRQIISLIQPLLGRAGSLFGAIAGQALQVLGWAAFVLAVSYFILLESGGLRERILRVEIPQYNEDVQRMGRELRRIWNAFLRGQFIIFVTTIIVYTAMLTLLGVRYALGLALVAGLARFVPYIGPLVTWTALALVAYFQPFKPFGASALLYAGIAVGLAVLIDQVFDSVIAPRIMGQALRVHPAGILVAAIIAANLLGLLGVVIAAPMLATLKLVGRYTFRKMLDLDPWPEEEITPPKSLSVPWRKRLAAWWERVRVYLPTLPEANTSDEDNP